MKQILTCTVVCSGDRQRAIRGRGGFTLVEIMIVVAIIGLLASLAVPTFITARKQSQGRRIINDARQIDSAVAQWAMEYGKKDGDTIDATGLSQLSTYAKGGVINTTDVLGNPYQIGPVGSNQVTISTSTKTALAGASIDWEPY